MIYLDAAATTKPKEEVIQAMMPYLTDMWQNPSSLYRSSVTVRNEIEKARNVIADFINAESDEIVFTSGGSESNCTAIQGFVNKCRSNNKNPLIITSKIEHKSILLCTEAVAHYNTYTVDVDKDGFVDMNMLESILQTFPNRSVLVTIQFANNEIGTIQHIKDISDMVHAYGGVFHTDAVQAFGHEGIDVKELGIDMLSASGHKIGAPKGIGILYIKNGIDISPLIYGTQENGRRGGTENVPYIIGLAEAVKIAEKKRLVKWFKVNRYQKLLMDQLENLGCTVNGSRESRLANNISVTFSQTLTGEALIYLLDTSGINISAGSACNSHSQSASHVLKAIGLSDRDAMRTVRLTLPDDFTADYIDKIIGEFKKAVSLLDISA